MLNELEGLEMVICIVDDILVHGKTQKEHDKRLEAVLRRLNPDMCEFSRQQLKLVGHGLSAQGIGPDPEKTAAIEKMERSQNVAELRKFLRRLCRFAIFFQARTNGIGAKLKKNLSLEDEERHDPSARSRSLLLRERNYHICERLIV